MSLFTPVSLRLRETSPAAFAAALGQSFRDTGFAVVSDHGLDRGVLEQADSAARRFFALPDEVKRRYQVSGGGGQRGYTPFGVEIAKGAPRVDLKEFWHVGRELAPGHPFARYMPANLDVAEIPGWSQTQDAMFNAMDALGRTLLSAIALDLSLPADFFDDTVRDGNSILRLLHYPPQASPPPEGSMRADAHEDINVITLLLGAEEGGLEVLHRTEGWVAVAPPPDALVVNIGDMLARLANDALPSTSHRVVNPRPERARHPRYSTPFFLHFRPDYLIRTLPGCVSADRPDRYPEPITAQAFLEERLRDIGLMATPPRRPRVDD